MVRRWIPRTPLVMVVLVMCLAASTAWGAPLQLVSAVSRMKHGNAGTFDVQLPLKGASGIECRTASRGLTIVLSFNQHVVAGTASVSSGVATVEGTPGLSHHSMTVRLTGVQDAQAITLTVANVANPAGDILPSTDVHLRVLQGDVNASGSVTAADVSICKAAVVRGSAVNGGNFRCDIDANGLLTSADLNLVKAQAATAGTVGPATANTPPTISSIPNQTAVSGQVMSPVGFTVGDAQSDPSTLTVSAVSSDQTIVANGNISLGGSGSSRTISLTPASGITATTSCTITVTVSDGVEQTSTSFILTVIPPPTVYLATLGPISGVNSFGSGSATLSLSGDLTYAVLKYSYSNLAGTDSDDAVYAPGDQVLYDIPVGKQHGDQQPDGSYKWVFGTNQAQAVAAIQANQSYITIESTAFPAGELRGTFQKIIGSQTFTPPPPPPAITINPPTPFDAARFLQQAAFGGQISEITTLSNPLAGNASTALNDWLTQQFNTALPIAPAYDSTTPVYSSSSMYKQIYDRVTTAQAPNNYGDTLSDDRPHEVWWKNAVTAPDQLRQRVATALSEILVVSEIDDNIDANIPGLTSYYDMLANDAFGNFRTILGDVTLHPIMGDYLNMKGNKKATPPASPNENYAREILQLFSIGLYMLQPDGTLMLDQNGQPIPTYDQSVITNFAQVFTGWDQNNTPVVVPQLIAPVPPATTPTISNFNSYYQKQMVLTSGNHSGTVKYLLGWANNNGTETWTGTYPSAPTYTAGGATQQSYIPTSTSPNGSAELTFALDDIFNHPNVGPFICKQLIQRLVSSNPSPPYVYRVVQVFNDDGSSSHVRGNMRAVITAILTDYEARNANLLTDPGYGRMREPMVRIANILRSCNGFSKTNKWQIGKTDNTFAQTIFRSPTVFNFFTPSYEQPGVVQNAGLVSPEFDIIYETTITNTQNMIYTGIYANYATNPPTGTGFRGDSYGSDVYLDFSTAGNGLMNVAQNQGVGPLLDRVGLLLTGAPLDPNVKNRIQIFISGSISPTDYLSQAKAAVHLIATAPQTAVQK